MSRSKRGTDWAGVLMILAFVALTVLGIWAWFAGPCWIYSWSKVGEVPTRCLVDLSRQ